MGAADLIGAAGKFWKFLWIFGKKMVIFVEPFFNFGGWTITLDEVEFDDVDDGDELQIDENWIVEFC